jgi:tripartite-type tricarboxylate transporter receptor subunit TctC
VSLLISLVPVVMEDRPGANGNIGTALAARSAPDGYTWLVTGPAVLVNPTLYSDAGWDAMKDFIPPPYQIDLAM